MGLLDGWASGYPHSLHQFLPSFSLYSCDCWDPETERVTFSDLMEGLVSNGINPFSAFGVNSITTKHHSHFSVPPSLQLQLHLRNNPHLVRMTNHSFKVSASSVGGPIPKVPHFHNTIPSKETIELWRNVDAVCFDVDSTVCVDEGIDELAQFCGAGSAVAQLTASAMGGSVPFEEALAARLALFNPSLSQLHNFLHQHPPRLSPGIEELVRKLKAKRVHVYLISGGFRQMINPVASILGIPQENIFANQLLFGSDGEFLGFDKNEPTSRSGGKATAVRQIRKAHEYKSLAMVGDGATDLEARSPGGADLFICYAGVQLREAVAAKADWLVFSLEDLINSL
ncbi:hypothetical protein RIF29_07920 [Crotalaria pallida]|uniref:phosphoserine phosphatase n=1 Tax=Crotalaria pallida TaxID=3830 RepID=A0AAN9J5S8_CROPI